MFETHLVLNPLMEIEKSDLTKFQMILDLNSYFFNKYNHLTMM